MQELSGTIIKLQDLCLHRNEQTLKARDETIAALDELNAAKVPFLPGHVQNHLL